MDLVVRDVPEATRFFVDVLGLTARYADDRFAELDTGSDVTIMLTPDLMIDGVPAAAGVVVHFDVADVDAEVRRTSALGARVLLEPTDTDWGTRMAMIAGPEGVVVSLHHGRAD